MVAIAQKPAILFFSFCQAQSKITANYFSPWYLNRSPASFFHSLPLPLLPSLFSPQLACGNVFSLLLSFFFESCRLMPPLRSERSVRSSRTQQRTWAISQGEFMAGPGKRYASPIDSSYRHITYPPLSVQFPIGMGTG